MPRELLTYLQQELPPLVQREIVIGGTIAPADAFDAERKQFLGSAFLEQLKRQPAGDADRVIGIIDADLYAPGLNFIFGQARLPGRVAVVAIPRLRERERVLKVATHELGHAYGFRHCDDTSCVMHFANSVRELDRSGRTYCARERIPR
ncbi:MAG TPA: matrixin family metalloprotease [Thermoanaerobaculia bacterium]|nr:matrixin family metalloprotease [Thermoanaerobaculia bacterium]